MGLNPAASADQSLGQLAFGKTDDFLKTVRQRVDEHFAGCKCRGDMRLYRKGVIIALWFFASYVLLLTVRVPALQILFCISYAFAAGAVGFNIFHDAGHGTFSSSRHVNHLLSLAACTVLGPGRYFWRFKHNVLHHRFTNVFEWDDDLETRGSLRLSPQQPWQAKFKNQHRWFYILYSFATLEWLFVKDFVQYFTSRINPYRDIPRLTRGEKIEFWSCKAVYFAVFLALPFMLLPTWHVIAGLVLFHVLLSLILTFVFNMAHATAKVDFPKPSGNPAAIEGEWGAHQMRTTANFATDNRVLNWYTGGLNFQIEHHLFPNVSHTHYPDISGIVRRTAQEFGLPYNIYETYFGTVKSHFDTLRILGTPPVKTA